MNRLDKAFLLIILNSLAILALATSFIYLR